jgi:hypothetical protein
MHQIRFNFIAATFTVLAIPLMMMGTASATSFCQPRQTRDGFVALRSAPEPSAKLVGRMKAEDEVQIGQGRRGEWIEVIWWRGDDRLAKGFDKVAGRGWTHRKLISDECG